MTSCRQFLPALLVVVLAGCGGADAGDSAEQPPAETVAAAPPTSTPTAAADPAQAERGAQLFVERACGTCHTLGGGRLVGPDLAGVTTRRSPEWIVAMIVNPDSMIRADPTAKQLFAEYMTPMANQNISEADALAMLAYLQREDGNQ